MLPPFLDLHRPLPPQLAVLAAVTIALDTLTMSAYGLGGVVLARRMNEPRFARRFRRLHRPAPPLRGGAGAPATMKRLRLTSAARPVEQTGNRSACPRSANFRSTLTETRA